MHIFFAAPQHIAIKIGKRWFLLGGLGYWLLLLGLSLGQAWNEAIIPSSLYGRYFLGSLVYPIVGLVIFFIIALFRPDDSADSLLGNSVLLQIFLLILIFVMSYWALKALLLANWLLLLGVLLILPLLYLGGVGIVNPNTLISLGAIGLTFVALELFLQVNPQIWPPIMRSHGGNWRRIHADVPFLVEETETITYRINELGFRGATPVSSKVDLIALGDSFTFGIGAQSPWPDRVAQKLGWQVLNLGMNGASPPSQIPPLTEFGLPRQPRVVIYAYFEGNDFYPCFQPARPQGARWGDKIVMPDILRIIDVKITRWLMPPPITSQINYDIVTPSEVEFDQKPVELTFAPAYISTLTMDRPRLETSENWRIVTQSLLQMRNLVEAQNTIFLLVYIPERTRVYWPLVRENSDVINRMYSDLTYQWVTTRKNCLKLKRRQPTRGETAFRDSMDTTIEEQINLMADFADENNILFLDLTEALRTQAETGAVLAEPLETHYNDYANNVIGTVIADYITDHIIDD